MENPPQPSSAGANDTRPREGLRPKRPEHAAGIRIDPPPSLAWAAGTTPPATAADAPPEDPPGVRSRFHGVRAGPKRPSSVTGSRPNSGRFLLPIITQPPP